MELEGRHRLFSACFSMGTISVAVTEVGSGNEEVANSPKSRHSESLCVSSPIACSIQEVCYTLWTDPAFLQS